MILGQLRMGARQAKNAPLLIHINLRFSLDKIFTTSEAKQITIAYATSIFQSIGRKILTNKRKRKKFLHETTIKQTTKNKVEIVSECDGAEICIFQRPEVGSTKFKTHKVEIRPLSNKRELDLHSKSSLWC